MNNNNINPSYGYQNNVSFGQLKVTKKALTKLKSAPKEVLEEYAKMAKECEHERHDTIIDYLGRDFVAYCPIKPKANIKTN